MIRLLAGAAGCRGRVLLVVALLSTGCSSVPERSSVQYGRAVPPADARNLGDADVRGLPPGPAKGAAPEAIVRGFLRAAVSSEASYAVARQFLTAEAAADWRPEGPVTIYDGSGASISVADGVGRLLARQSAVIGPEGSYTPVEGRISADFRLASTPDGWRLSSVPDGLLLTDNDVSHVFRSVYLYYLDPSLSVLVPDHRFIRSSQPRLATAMISALLHGPSPWLGPSVANAVPPGTRLLGNASRGSDGVVEVNLSDAVVTSGPEGLSALSAQIVWTLRQLTEVSGVRLLVNGQPLAVPGGSRGVQARTDWPSYDPRVLAGPVNRLWVQDGRLYSPDPGRAARAANSGVRAPSVSPDGTITAALRGTGEQTALAVGPSGGALRNVVTAAGLTPPSVDREGVVWTVSAGASTSALLAFSGGRRLSVSAPELQGRQVAGLRLSRDGTRAAAILGAGDEAQLFVGRVVRRPGRQLVLEAFRGVAPQLRAVSSMSWLDDHRIAVLGRSAAGGSSGVHLPFFVEYDASAPPLAVSVSGLPVGDLRALAAAPGQPLLIESRGEIWWYAGGTWDVIGRGTDPTYQG
ncbi:MAG: LpqB family beta-propeller domain-containing protein [Actinomycetota bacterium]|nr:LpqB family beta-propeller domain-containing protein [Actinomycetota bacterium]